ncbi:MAG TPA: sigma-70 family RNA polymerase sigma factor [Vicinamibacterales bacterium]|nr:sigma-70 family RNA polymerase sigma factor [Vicinamibacterales bacterium]
MLDYREIDELIVVALAQNGDRDALEALLRRFYGPLRAFVMPLVGSSHADDVLQEIALIIFQNLRYLRHPAAFRSWAFRLASRRAFRYLKRETRWKRLDLDVIASLPAPLPLPEALEPGLLKAIEQVSPASRAVLLLHYQQGLSIEETALALDIPVGTAKSRLAYGVSVLRKLINQKGTP